MTGFPNMDMVEQYVHGQTYAKQQYQTEPPVTGKPQNNVTAVMLTDSQFDKLLAVSVNQPVTPAAAPAQPRVQAAPPVYPPVQTAPQAQPPVQTAPQSQPAVSAPNGAINENIVDALGNITFGTINRTGKTITTLVNNLLDIVTFGYGSK